MTPYTRQHVYYPTPFYSLVRARPGQKQTLALQDPEPGLDISLYFDDSRNMKTTAQVVEALSALAQESRLNVYRLLVEAGPEGLPAGRISEELDLPAPTLSFHLAHLARAGLARSRQEGRFVIYSADFQNMNELVGYLTENCCGGRACGPSSTRGGQGRAPLPRARIRA